MDQLKYKTVMTFILDSCTHITECDKYVINEFYPNSLERLWDIVFTHGIRLGVWVSGLSGVQIILFGLYFRNNKGCNVDAW